MAALSVHKAAGGKVIFRVGGKWARRLCKKERGRERGQWFSFRFVAVLFFALKGMERGGEEMSWKLWNVEMTRG